MTAPATSGSLTPQNSQSDIQPVYTFRIERRPGEGYTVVSSEGQDAERQKQTALKLLDAIGQPDPKGPQQYERLVQHAEYCVRVSVQLQPDGTAQIRQKWFSMIPSAAHPGSWRRVAQALLLCFLLGAGAGAWAGYSLGKQSPPPPTTAQKPEKKNETGKQPPPPPDETLKTLRDSLVRNQEVLQTLKQFLSQEGLAAPKEGASEKKRSIKVLVDLDPLPPGIRESLTLNNQQVRQLLDLLQELLDALQRLEKLNNPGSAKTQSSSGSGKR
ncbi:MAG: hypothetical protein WHU94_10975 [Thermogemmata sp.]